jgi:uncharacterized protein YndB with AHSA1/START domain
MPREFELHKEVELEASPEQVWEAIATGPGITSWFMTHRVEPGEGGAVTLDVGGFTAKSTITAWEPPERFAVRGGSDDKPESFEYVVEARDGASTVMRFVQSGFLGDDWESEYESMNNGWDMYFHTLGQYLKYFPGRKATYTLASGPEGSAQESAWVVLLDGLGLIGPLGEGDRVRLALDGIGQIDGIVDYLRPTFLGIRASDALYRFHGLAALRMPVAVGHHLYADGVDGKESDRAWEAWLNRVFA